jgi:ABC-type transporter Mla subunit MlaD
MTACLLLSHLLLLGLIFGLVNSCAQRSTSAQVSNASQSSSAGSDASSALAGFQKRVEDYAAHERKLESKLPKLPEKAEPDRIIAHKQALAKAIQQARSGAKQGDLFTQDIRPLLVQIIRSETGGPKGAETRKEIVETAAKTGQNETSALVSLKVNSPYPDNVSLSTVPPDLLLKLPPLPREVDYRFVGRNVILRSVKANLILDVLPGALSPPRIKKQ